jgi:hypothetical protein
VDGCPQSVLNVTAAAGIVSAVAIDGSDMSKRLYGGGRSNNHGAYRCGNGPDREYHRERSGFTINVNSVQGYSGGDETITVGVVYNVVP